MLPSALTFGGGLTVNPASAVADASPAVTVLGPLCVGDGVADGVRTISALDDAMVPGTTRTISVGQSTAPNGQADLSFTFAGPGDDRNSASLGLSNAPRLYVTQGGVGVDTPTPSHTLEVAGEVCALNVTTQSVRATDSDGRADGNQYYVGGPPGAYMEYSGGGTVIASRNLNRRIESILTGLTCKWEHWSDGVRYAGAWMGVNPFQARAGGAA